MLKVKIFTSGCLAKNWNALAPIKCMSGFGNRESIGKRSGKRSGIVMEVEILD